MRSRSVSITIRRVHAQAVHTKGIAVKKTIVAAALVLSLVAVGCSNNAATPAPEAVESVAAEVEDAAESVAAEVEDAAESSAAEASPAG
jgi:uncharacterized lipoprotein NlpE involved in copper resistance